MRTHVHRAQRVHPGAPGLPPVPLLHAGVAFIPTSQFTPLVPLRFACPLALALLHLVSDFSLISLRYKKSFVISVEMIKVH